MNIDRIINDIKSGVPIVVVDDYDRENEADIVLSASQANISNLLFCMKHARGLMCLPCMQPTLDRLNIPMMPSNKRDKLGTPFTVSVDAVEGTTTGMSVSDRLKTIQIMTNEVSTPNQLSQPGHMFPLRANKDLLKGRRGHTEASIELMKLSNEPLVSIIMEIVNDDGTMLTGKQSIAYAKIYNLNIITLAEIYDKVYNKSV